jgi:hypothetical protein
MQRSKSVTSSVAGSMKIYHIITSYTPVEDAAPTMALVPAWPSPQGNMPREQHQAQQGYTGPAVR